MICKNCGTVNEEGVRFCMECGSPLLQDEAEEILQQAATAAEEFVNDVKEDAFPAAEPAPKEEYRPEPVPQPVYQPQPAYQPQPVKNEAPAPAPAPAPAAAAAAAAAEPAKEKKSKEKKVKEKKAQPAQSPTVRAGTFFFLELVFAIPVLGLLLAIIVSAASGRSPSRRNFCKSVITWHIIGLALLVLLAIAVLILNQFAKEPVLDWLNNVLTYNTFKNCENLWDVCKELATYGISGLHFR